MKIGTILSVLGAAAAAVAMSLAAPSRMAEFEPGGQAPTIMPEDQAEQAAADVGAGG